jgi:hypothetical protein
MIRRMIAACVRTVLFGLLQESAPSELIRMPFGGIVVTITANARIVGIVPSLVMVG